MSDGTHIEWTDATWNVVNGCSVLSPGCTNCYAMRLAGTRLKHHPSRAALTIDTRAGPVWTGEVRFNDKVLLDPLKWRRPRKIFVCAHGDLFHEKVPDEWLDRVFAVMALAPQHVFQVLTKRPDRMRAYVQEQAQGGRYVSDHISRILAPSGEHGYDTTRLRGAEQELLRDAIRRGCGGSPGHSKPAPNVWLGVSVEDQARADQRIPVLLDTPAAVRWLSCEPLLGPVDLSHLMPAVHHHPDNRDRNSPAMQGLLKAARDKLGGGIDWVVAGGESGPGARAMHPDWARSLRDQCTAAGVPFLFKQWGAWAPVVDDGDDRHVRQWVLPPDAPRLGPVDRATDALMHRPGKKAAGRLLDGVQHDGYPA